MGIRTEQNMLTQLKKGQGETNERLDKLIEAVTLNTQWLAELSKRLEQPAG